MKPREGGPSLTRTSEGTRLGTCPILNHRMKLTILAKVNVDFHDAPGTASGLKFILSGCQTSAVSEAIGKTGTKWYF